MKSFGSCHSPDQHRQYQHRCRGETQVEEFPNEEQNDTDFDASIGGAFSFKCRTTLGE